MVRVEYNGLIADIRPDDLEAGLASLRQESDEGRAVIMKSVCAALDEILEVVAAKRQPTPKQLQNTANDIGLWFANEVIEGRVEQCKVAMQ